MQMGWSQSGFMVHPDQKKIMRRWNQFLSSETGTINEKMDPEPEPEPVPLYVENDMETKYDFKQGFLKIEVICKVLGPWFGNKAEPA